MILTVPYQAIEVSNVHLNPFQTDKYGKAIARLAYKDTSIDFYDVPILSPPLKIIDYNPENSRLRLALTDQFQFKIKLNTIQEYLISTFFVHQQSFLMNSKSYEEIRELFNFLLVDDILSVYIYPTAQLKKSDGTIGTVSELKSCDTVRFVLRLQGITQINTHHSTYLRLQHTIPSIWLLP